MTLLFCEMKKTFGKTTLIIMLCLKLYIRHRPAALCWRSTDDDLNIFEICKSAQKIFCNIVQYFCPKKSI